MLPSYVLEGTTTPGLAAMALRARAAKVNSTELVQPRDGKALGHGCARPGSPRLVREVKVFIAWATAIWVSSYI